MPDWEDYDTDEDAVFEEDETIDGRGETERLDTETVNRAAALHLRPMGHRPVRLTSIEQEVGSGGGRACVALHHAGLTGSPTMDGYHTTRRGRTDRSVYACVPEHDSSCGGEFIWDRLLLSDPVDAGLLARGQGALRPLLQSRAVRFTMDAGLHVHVDAHRLGMETLESLYHLTCYLEDVLFRLASANWSTHRADRGSGYASPIRKGLNGRSAIGATMALGRDALNLSPYLQARHHCACNATQYEAWQECTCLLPAATIEWRVFNATGNVRKLHAYTALANSLIARAQLAPHDPAAYPSNAYQRLNGIAPDAARVEAWTSVLDFLFRKVPFTRSERAALVYCGRRSELRPAFTAERTEAWTMARYTGPRTVLPGPSLQARPHSRHLPDGETHLYGAAAESNRQSRHAGRVRIAAAERSHIAAAAREAARIREIAEAGSAT